MQKQNIAKQNAQELERMRALVGRLADDDPRRAVNEYWTVAGILCHIAFWDTRVVALAGKLERGVPFSPSDAEPDDVASLTPDRMWPKDRTSPLNPMHASHRAEHLDDIERALGRHKG